MYFMFVLLKKENERQLGRNYQISKACLFLLRPTVCSDTMVDVIMAEMF